MPRRAVRRTALVMIMMGMFGCATGGGPDVLRAPSPPVVKGPTAFESKETTPAPSPTKAAGTERAVGAVFGKTDFRGLVRASYVKLTIQSLLDPETTYELYIGDKARQERFPWVVQTVRPGYFFLEFPPGDYRIISISIPVGTTQASEETDITFHVEEGEVLYLGTLRVDGVRERVKVGGIPLVKPGFIYRLEVIDEGTEARTVFRGMFPDERVPLTEGLLRIGRATNAATQGG